MKTIEGIIEYMGEEYDYTAVLQASGRDYMPERVTDLDRADGQPMSEAEREAFEAMADLALENARLLDWCERNGWQVEDTGGGCTALLNTEDGKVVRLTRLNDPSMPQTFGEPILAGEYDADDRPIAGGMKTFSGGIDEMLRSGR
jgi:hypothetical protein